MTYFSDLSPYRYVAEVEDSSVNVGWLAAERPFPVGAVPGGLVEAILRLVQNEPVHRMRGFKGCELCPDDDEYYPTFAELDGLRVYLGDCEIRVKGRGAAVYAAPSMIAHYIGDHGYRPPAEFIEAVMGDASRGGE